MSTTPLSERIENAPSSLPLADRLTSPTPSMPLSLAERLADDPPYIPDSPVLTEEVLAPIDTRPPSRAHSEPSEAEVDIGMIGRDLATLAGFSMFDRTDPNHHCYGQKIDMPDGTSRWPHYIQFIVDTNSHNHYVYATRDDLRRAKYGWVLEAAPFIGCMSPGVDESDLQVLLGSEDQRLGVDIALNTINDKGVTADTDRLREAAMEDVDLTRREHELAAERTHWRVRNAEIRSRLVKAKVHSRVHPYLNHTALIPDHYRPETMRTGGVTLATAISDTHERSLRWHTMPQYHDEDAQASRSSRPTPFPHRCRLCHQLQPRHTVWNCPARRDCHYCRGHDHLSENCNNPHAICFTKSQCIVPFTHRHALSRMARRCPAAHLHSRYYTDDWAYDGEDTTYDDYDWEA